MSTVTIPSPIRREPELLGQTVVVIGGSAGIGFETARRARAEGAKVILTSRNAERLQQAASEVDALSTARFTQMDGKARGCVGTAARRRWQSQEPLPLGVWSRKPSARRPGRAGSHF